MIVYLNLYIQTYSYTNMSIYTFIYLHICMYIYLYTRGAYATAPTSIITSGRFMGWIDELAFYNRVLSDTEIKSNW